MQKEVVAFPTLRFIQGAEIIAIALLVISVSAENVNQLPQRHQPTLARQERLITAHARIATRAARTA